MKAELGAEFIHGRAEETKRIPREAGIRVAAMRGGSWVCGTRGYLQRGDKGFRLADRVLEGARVT